MTPAVPRPAMARTANASRARGASVKSCMVSSAVGLPTYGGEPRADWVDGCLDPLPGAHEERLLVGCGEPPAGSSVTALRSGFRPAGAGSVTTARPPAAGLNVPRLTGFCPFLMAQSWYVRPDGAGGRSKAASTTRPRARFQ